MAVQMSALLDQRAAQGLVGRSRELAMLRRMMSREDETLLARSDETLQRNKKKLTRFLEPFNFRRQESS